MMKVAQVIPCLGRNSGGPSRSVYELAKGLRSIGVESEILTYNYLENPNVATDNWIRTVNVRKKLPFEYSNSYKNLFKDYECDLFHIHSIYSYPVSFAANYARKHGIPYIIAPRGSLYEAAIVSSSEWKKKVFNRLFLYQDLKHAAVVHATCQEEMEQIRRLGINTPIAIIPNSISLPDSMPMIQTPSKLRLCYLGRINPIKNIDGLLRAWHKSGLSGLSETELVIIGDAQLEREQRYLNELRIIEKELKINNIVWKGNLQGEEKNKLLNKCSFLILPSHSENFGVVVIEALVQGVPVIASKGTPWACLETNCCGWWIDNDVDSMSEMLKSLLEVPSQQRLEMSLNGQALVKNYFSTDSVSNSLKQLYSWILNGSTKLDFIH